MHKIKMTAAVRTPATLSQNQIFDNRPEKRKVMNLKSVEKGVEPSIHEAVPKKSHSPQS